MTSTTQHSITPLKNHFLFAEGEVRTAIDERGEPWFCAKDVCAALDIQWPAKGTPLKSLSENRVMTSYHETIKGERDTVNGTGQGNRLLRRRNVEEKTGLSRATIYLLMKAGSFPKPIPLNANRVAWLEAEIDEWINQRIEARKK